jgi:hypothetical protein
VGLLADPGHRRRTAAAIFDAALTLARNVNSPGREPDAAMLLASILVRSSNVLAEHGSENEVGSLLWILADGIGRRIVDTNLR